MTNRGISSIETSATGTDWVQLSETELPCDGVVIYNDSGTTLRVRYCTTAGAAIGGGASLPIIDGSAQPMPGIRDAREVQVKRDDDDTTQVDVSFWHGGA